MNLQHLLQKFVIAMDHYEQTGDIYDANIIHNNFIKMAQQAPGNAYNNYDMSNIPPAISAMLANLNYKITQLDATQKQMSQQMSGANQKPQHNQQNANLQAEIQQYQNVNQNPVTPNTMNYIQTPGSTPAPIEISDGEINV